MNMQLTDSANRILDIAEVNMRRAGYNAVSFRDIASEMGMKSASLHYHFPKKEDMGVALVQRYAANFAKALYQSTIMTDTPKEKLAVFVNLYRIALEDHQLICLCAVLGAEAQGLPAVVTSEVKIFFTENIEWLTHIYTEMGTAEADVKAKSTLSLLEGAMIISAVNEDNSVFEAAATLILSDAFR